MAVERKSHVPSCVRALLMTLATALLKKDRFPSSVSPATTSLTRGT